MSYPKFPSKLYDNIDAAKEAADYNNYTAVIRSHLTKQFYIISTQDAKTEASLKGVDNFTLASIKQDGVWLNIALYNVYFTSVSAKQNASLDKEPILVKKNGLYQVFYGAEPFGFPLVNGGLLKWNKGTYIVLSRYTNGRWNYV